MMNDNDEKQANQQPQPRHTEDPGTSGKPANSNGRQNLEPRLDAAAEASGKRTVSPRKVEANRRNARKSTGPKTAAGKKRVSKNAIRHGFYSKCLLVHHPDGKESQAEYNDFYADIRKHFQPVGWLEGHWVEKIAVWSWRLRRLIRGETGQIDRALAEHSYEVQQSRADDRAEPESAPSSFPEMDTLTDHLFLPERDELDRLLRRETMINRQLNHALAELERIQARREGATSAV
jgi:hypothetical protein